jgi:hypothetical protein
MRRKQCCSAVILAIAVAAVPGVGHADDAAAGQVRLKLGWTYLGLRESFPHATHPDDAFLPNASVPGSAGTTALDHGNFFQLGVGYEWQVFPRWMATIDIGGLFGDARDERQNANDPRPAAQGAFIYSKARYGVFVQPQLLYKIAGTNFSVGVSARLDGVYVDQGWARFSSDQTESAAWKVFPRAGPAVRFDLSTASAIEASAQYGSGGAAASVSWIWKFK